MKEKDSCGVGFVCTLRNRATREVLENGIEAVKNLTHRGAVGADGKTGDGCGILFEIPRAFFLRFLDEQGASFDQPPRVACGTFFLSGNARESLIENCLAKAGVHRVYFRHVPVESGALGADSLRALPRIIQAVIPHDEELDAMERRLYIAGRMIERTVPGASVVSLSAYTIVYKAMLAAPVLDLFYPDLRNEEFVTRFCIFHQRYSTNTEPRWNLAQPFHCLGHNGEINTIKGNRNRFSALEAAMSTEWIDRQRSLLLPLLDDEESDSASLDRALRLLTLSGYSPEHAINLLIPPAWEGIPFVEKKIGACLQYNGLIMEPWDGPAAVVFTDGKTIGAHLDRNGLRPLRYAVTEDGLLIAGSETGMIALNGPVLQSGKLGSGDTIAVRLDSGRIKNRMEILNELAIMLDFETIVKSGVEQIKKQDEPAGARSAPDARASFGCTAEEVETVIPYAAKSGKELTWSMGDDTPLPPLANNPQPLFRYFRQKFAQVTNPPIDPLRERLVMSLSVYLGEYGNMLDFGNSKHARKLLLPSPVLSGAELHELGSGRSFPLSNIPTLYNKARSLRTAVGKLCDSAADAVRNGAGVLVLTDREMRAGCRFIPSLLAVAAVNARLRKESLAHCAAIVAETGEARDSHHVACLIGYGAHAVYPWLGYEIAGSAGEGDRSRHNYRTALEDGLFKIISKMGISCISSYRDSRLFDALCLNRDVIDEFFQGTDRFMDGHGLDDIERSYAAFYHAAFSGESPGLPVGGNLKFRKDGEWHSWSPALLKPLNRFLQTGDEAAFREFSRVANEDRPVFLRHLFDLPPENPIPVEEVAPVESLLRTFATGGMSLGALSPEAHETLIAACNRLGMKCNSGEGGEDPERYGTEKGSTVKQVASGRFGVTPAYLASAREIEIKVAQGAKPGEGGQLPGDKVSGYIAYLRYAQPGITLISPPPHHDIYSIEDLAQLINDLKQANPVARVCVKLVSSAGIGQIASGVAKAYADVIQISSAEGGTGASPYVSIKNAGCYWEQGLIESHCTLVANGLRERVTLRVDGGFRTGRDVVVAALLGAEEFGFGTAAMLAEGCIMARQCHANTCPTGIATQDPELRKRFRGTVEGVTRYFTAVAGEVRQILARLGYRSLEELTGRASLLREKAWPAYPGARSMRPLLTVAGYDGNSARHCDRFRNEPAGAELNERICGDIHAQIEKGEPVVRVYPIRNTDRSVPVRLSYLVSKAFSDKGLPPDTIKLRFEGTAGQSFGAFTHRGISLELVGEANDYAGKGMHGGRIVIRPGKPILTRKNYIAGNTLLYGATGGEFFAAGRVGERFAVRNSGASAVIEGAGHHLCEYMTGGVVLVLGAIGLNAGSGMTGGILYFYDEYDSIEKRINRDYVTAAPVDENDRIVIRALLEKHYYYTSSAWCGTLIQSFDRIISSFKKIIPVMVKG